MPDFGADYRYAKDYFRRKCTVDGVLVLARLTALADQIAGCAMEEVLIVSSTFEGGSAQGQAKFNKMAAGQAVEDLIKEADPTLPREVDQTQASFRRYGLCTPPLTT